MVQILVFYPLIVTLRLDLRVDQSVDRFLNPTLPKGHRTTSSKFDSFHGSVSCSCIVEWSGFMRFILSEKKEVCL